MGSAISGAAAPRCDHVVQLYGSEDELIGRVGPYVRSAVGRGEAAIVVATPLHRAGFEGFLGAAPGPGSVTFLDAAESLAAFLVDGLPSRGGFDRVVGARVREAAAGGRAVQVFGEMVALLWSRGLIQAAIQLETFWNDLARETPFSLVCGYPSDSTMSDQRRHALKELCALHSAVVGSPPVRDGGWREEGVVRSFAAIPDSPRAARRFVAETLRDRSESRLAADAELIVSELATNSIVHASSHFTVAIATTVDTVRVSVTDGSSALPARRSVVPTGMGGRGLHIVGDLATRWAVESRPGGKVVWAELGK